MRTVAVLCAASNSVYFDLPGVEVYDAKRDARTFAGGMPVVAHPPCRAWSPRMRHLAIVPDGEPELGLWCCEQLRKWGGVLEQPAGSGLFEAAGLPAAGVRDGDLWTIGVHQSWWGYSIAKPTWLCFSGVDVSGLDIPFQIHAGNDWLRFKKLSKNQRSATCRPLAEWLVDAARRAQRTEC